MNEILTVAKGMLAVFGGLAIVVIVAAIYAKRKHDKMEAKERMELRKKRAALEELHDQIDSNYGVARAKANVLMALGKAKQADFRCDNIDVMVNKILTHLSVRETYDDERFNSLLEVWERIDAKLPKAKGKK